MGRRMIPALITVALLWTAPPASAHGDVEILDSSFSPQTLVVAPGKTVVWAHEGSLPHSVTAADGSWDSSPGCSQSATAACMSSGDEFSRTFTEPGTVNYLCKVHAGMTGTIQVVDPASVPTSVTSLEATSSAGTISVSGAALFGGEPPQLIAEDAEGDPPVGPQTAQLGLDLSKAYLHRPDPAKNEVEFVWEVTQLDREAPPEIVRYLWQMKVNGENGPEYWIQAKTMDLLSGTNVADDPAGHASHVQGAFKLRGNCGPIVSQVPNFTTCRHVAWLTGVFDAAADQVRVQLPLGQAYAPAFAPGAEITPFGTIEAGLQAAASNNSTADQVSAETAYRIASKTVALGIAPAGTPEAQIVFGSPGTLAADDSFTGSLDTAGLAPGSYDVWAKACFGVNCGTSTVTITI